jgi:hypothetical protein
MYMRNRFQTTVIALFLLLAQVCILASPPDEQLVANGLRQLERQILINADNERRGRSHENQYVIVLDAGVDAGEYIEERGSASTRLMSGTQLRLLDQQLVTFHNAYSNSQQTGFYVLLVNNWKLRLAKQLSAEFTLNEWSDLRAFAAAEESRELDGMLAQLNSVPSEILRRLQNKGYRKQAYVYMYARITATDVDGSTGSAGSGSAGIRTRSRQFVSQVFRAAEAVNIETPLHPYVLDVRQLLAKGYYTHFERVAANVRNFVDTWSNEVAAAGRADEAAVLRIGPGPGYELFINLPPTQSLSETEKTSFVALCHYLNEQAEATRFAFWLPSLSRAAVRAQDGKIIQRDVLSELYDSRLLTIEAFNGQFVKRSSREYPTLWVTVEGDLTEGIPENYNQFTKDHLRGGVYRYSLDDLISRKEQRALDSYFWQAIRSAEKNGKAEPVSQADGVEQYVALYNHSSSLFYWMKNYFIEVAEPATIANIARTISRFKSFSPNNQLRADAETSVASSRRLQSLEKQYSNLAATSKQQVDKLAQLDGVGIIGDDAGNELLILGRQTTDEYVEVGRVVDGRVAPLHYVEKGTPLGGVFDGHQLVRDGEEVGFLRRVDDASSLSKFEDFPNIKTWTGSLSASGDRLLIDKLFSLERTDLEKLNVDIAHRNYGSEIRELLRENPDDVVEIWKRLKDDPAYSWELQKTGGSRWEKWGQREFFKDVTAKGKHFERDVCLVALRNRSSAAYLELKNKVAADFGKNLDEYDMYSQVQLKYDGEEYFVADQVFVRYRMIGGQKLVEDLVIIENKLSRTTSFTAQQSNALAHRRFVVRSQSVSSEFGTGMNLMNGRVLEFVDNAQWIKVSDEATGNQISQIQTVR